MGTEINSTLYGTGLGLDIFYRRTVKLSMDYGIALKGVSYQIIKPGHQEVHFRATLVY
jgi:hemolysin activation/secretion protein